MVYVCAVARLTLFFTKRRPKVKNAAKICNSFRPFPSFQLATCKCYTNPLVCRVQLCMQDREKGRAANVHIFIFAQSKSMGKKCFAFASLVAAAPFEMNNISLGLVFFLFSLLLLLLQIHEQMCASMLLQHIGTSMPSYGQLGMRFFVTSSSSSSVAAQTASAGHSSRLHKIV